MKSNMRLIKSALEYRRIEELGSVSTGLRGIKHYYETIALFLNNFCIYDISFCFWMCQHENFAGNSNTSYEGGSVLLR